MPHNPIRILHVIGAMNRGGAETIVMNLYRAIDRSEVQFDFLVHTDEACDYDDEIRALGGRIFSVPRLTGPNILSYRRACRAFFAEHREFPIVHGHIGSCAAIYLSEAKKTGAFTVAHSHSQHFPLSPAQIAFRTASFPTRFIADYFIACSQQAGIDRYGEKATRTNRYHILKNGIGLASYRFSEEGRAAVRRELGLPENAAVYGHVGRFDPIKNHGFLIDVFLEALAENPDSYLVMTGREDAEGAVRKRCESEGIMDKVRILGLREDIPRVLCALDVFIFPSFKEGLPLATVEAQASGLPCLMSTGVPELARATDAAAFLPLSDGARTWAHAAAEKLAAARGADRTAAIDQVRAAGFDIEESAAWLQDFYLQHAKR